MDWNAFFGAFTWMIAILSAVGAFCFGVFSIDEEDTRVFRLRITCSTFCGVIAVLSVATIFGMGWGPR